jgi:hypothetical protein
MNSTTPIPNDPDTAAIASAEAHYRAGAYQESAAIVSDIRRHDVERN